MLRNSEPWDTEAKAAADAKAKAEVKAVADAKAKAAADAKAAVPQNPEPETLKPGTRNPKP